MRVIWPPCAIRILMGPFPNLYDQGARHGTTSNISSSSSSYFIIFPNAASLTCSALVAVPYQKQFAVVSQPSWNIIALVCQLFSFPYTLSVNLFVFGTAVSCPSSFCPSLLAAALLLLLLLLLSPSSLSFAIATPLRARLQSGACNYN